MSDDADHTDRRHDDTPDPEEVLERAIDRLRDPATRSRARRALERMRERRDQRDHSPDAVHELEGELAAAKRADVTDEMCEDVSPAQVRAYLDGAKGWDIVDAIGGASVWWEHAWGMRVEVTEDEEIERRGYTVPATHHFARIAAAEGRGEVAVWLDVRAQEVGDE